MRVLARLASLAQIGELARRLVKPRRRLSRLYPYQLSHMALKCDKRFEISAIFGRLKSLQNVGTSGYFLACTIFRTSFCWCEVHICKISTYIPKNLEYS